MNIQELTRSSNKQLVSIGGAYMGGLVIANWFPLGNLEALSSGLIYGGLFSTLVLFMMMADHTAGTHDGINGLERRMEVEGLLTDKSK